MFMRVEIPKTDRLAKLAKVDLLECCHVAGQSGDGLFETVNQKRKTTMSKDWKPPTFTVYCTVAPTKRNSLDKPHTHRVGTTHDAKLIPGMIAEDRRAMCDTFGGLIDAPGASGRTYKAFKAEWTEVSI